MIKAEELRLGNIVMFLDKYMLVRQISYDDIIVSPNKLRQGEMYEINGIHLIPVELTPEILGIIKTDIHFCREYHLVINTNGVLIGKMPHGVSYLPHIKYLHQLQNLIYCLTGEELQIDITKLNK